MDEKTEDTYTKLFTQPSPDRPFRFETKRFIVRPMRPADVNARYVSWWNDEETQLGNNRKPQSWTHERAVKHIHWFDNKNNFHFGIFVKESKELIGFMSLLTNKESAIAKSNVVLDRSYWGKNVVPEVRAVLVELAFKRMKMVKFKGLVIGRNYPSIFNYLTMGFTCEGVQRSDVPFVGGGRADVYHFALFPEEWEARKKKGSAAQRKTSGVSKKKA
ncbi:GNAT family N-acetyltransferase [Limibacillus halophilus]|uniref:RimJ/RimL family protein N-acetyltransferase n=1 Tax=Limibacillus halophilus TaxID=1579333 RepID=A0A839SR55_9PROT|nr:GNAT family protein [Limibacillus halophilus]MBB3063846.1 RimJ/RimL family protein N-acetyltransferase [Limibacillus halophilus]